MSVMLRWRLSPGGTALKAFFSTLPCLRDNNIKEPYRSISCVQETYRRHFLLPFLMEMSVEIENHGAFSPELQGFATQILKKPETRTYTREFLLMCSELDICKQLPPGGFDPLVVSDLQAVTREIRQPWRRSPYLSADTFGKTPHGSPQSIIQGKIPPTSDAPLLKLPSWLNRESNSHGNRNLGNGQRDDLRGLPDAPQYKAGLLDQSLKEARITGCYQLSKSDNPYRPPHCHQVGSTKLEDEYLSENSYSSEENAKPHLVANVESDTGCSTNVDVCEIESFGRRTLTSSSSEKHSANLVTTWDGMPSSDIQSSDLYCTGAPKSEPTYSDEWTKSTDYSRPYEFPLADALDLLTSTAGECITATRPRQTSVMCADVGEQTELHEMEDDEVNFGDVWSEVSAIMRFEQEMDQTADIEIQVSSNEEDSVIWIAHPSSCKPSEGNKCGNAADSEAETRLPDEKNSDDSSYSDADICLPDENSLISMDHMIAPADSIKVEEHENSVEDDTLISDGDAKGQEAETVYTSQHRKESVPLHSTALPFRSVMKGWLAHQKMHFQQTYQQSCPWTGNPAVAPPPLHPCDYQQIPWVVPMSPYPHSAVNWYSCTNMYHHQPALKDWDLYSLKQQPKAFPGQGSHRELSLIDDHLN